jgi:hypothetical protein
MIALACFAIAFGEAYWMFKAIYPYSNDLSIEEFLSRAPLNIFMQVRAHAIMCLSLLQLGTILAIRTWK